MKLRKKQKRKIFFLIIGFLLLLTVFLDTFILLKYKVLPLKYLNVYYIVFGLIPILLVLYTIFKPKSKLKWLFSFFEIIYIFILVIAFFYLNKTFNFLNDFTSAYNYESKTYYVLTLNIDNYKVLEDIKEKKISYAGVLDANANFALEELKRKVNLDQNEVSGYTEMLEKLDSGEFDGALIAQSYYDILLENDDNIITKYKILYKFSIKEKIIKYVKDVDVTKESFNVYITGIDSYDSVTDATRSDVNIIVSVNPKTHKVLLINIPRDYYVELVGDEKKVGVGNMDKLTHAGYYGVETSVKTLEKLLDTEINYYVKVNYNALIKLVDALGGVDVESIYDFMTYEYHYRIKKGINHVNGKMALDFVRTRKAFKDGDRVRGENQQRMIEAIYKKINSSSILIKYGDLLKAVDGSFATNISIDKITSAINMQLDKMPKWEFKNLSLNGTDNRKITYSFKAQELYVMIPNEDTINEIKEELELNMK